MGGDQKGTSGKYEPADAARAAFQQFTEDRAWEDAVSYTHLDVYKRQVCQTPALPPSMQEGAWSI